MGIREPARRPRVPEVAATAVLVVLAAALSASLAAGMVDDVRVDSRSWWQLPVSVAAALPVLWWRRSAWVAAAVSCALVAGHVLAFGHLVRCGSGLPLAFVLAFLAGLDRSGRLQRLGAAALAVAVAGLVLVRDTAAGLELMPTVVLIQAGLVVTASVLRHRAALTDRLRVRNDELHRLRDERAGLEVVNDRSRLSADLEALLDRRLGELERRALAGAESAGSGDPEATRGLLAAVEEDSRRTLEEMRELVGLLRGGETGLAPAPSVAHLDALLTRETGPQSRLWVTGDPRVLPASVELSAYRIVEHLLGVLAAGGSPQVRVSMHFEDRAVTLEVTGPLARGADVRTALGRARERALVHAGSLEVKLTRGRARVVASLPTPGA